MRKTAALDMAVLRKKRKINGVVGKIPTEPCEILRNLPEFLTKTTQGGPFLIYKDYLYEDDESKIVLIFISEHGKFVLRNSVELFVDGTFDLAPEPFSQIYVVLGRMADKRPVPAVFALLPDKSGDTYKTFVEVVKKEVIFRQNMPEKVMLDFEKACWNAFSLHLPQSILGGCLFHLKQAVKKQITNKGLQILYNQQIDFNFFVKMIFSLVYIRPADVITAWEDVVLAFFDEHENDEGFDECAEPLTDFIAYIERTWLGKKVGRSGHRQVPLFPIESWNKHNAVLNGEPLTNNYAESFNHGFASSVETSPNLLNIITAFQRKDSWAEKTLQEESLAVGVQMDQRKRRVSDREARRLDLQLVAELRHDAS